MTKRPQFCLVFQSGEFPVPLVYFKKWSQRVIQVKRDLRRSQSNLKFRAVSALTSAPAAHCFVQLGGFHSKDRDCKTPGNLFHCSSCLITKIFAQPQLTILAALHWSHSSFSASFFFMLSTGHSVPDATEQVLSKTELPLPSICRNVQHIIWL